MGIHDPGKLRAVLENIQKYFDAGKHQHVFEAIKGLASRNTLKNWLGNPDEINKAYKADVLLTIRERLPKLSDLKTDEVYSFALNELDLTRESQRYLERYHGVYAVHHAFACEGPKTLVVNANSTPRFVSFWFLYQSAGKRAHCDGLVVVRQGRLYFLGLAKASMFFAHFRTVPDPANDTLRGAGTFEDMYEDTISSSNIVLVKKSRAPREAEMSSIMEYLGLPKAA